MPRVRVIEIDSEAHARAQLGEIGASKPGRRIMSRKAVHRVLRINSLGATALSILKQEMLSIGAEAGIPANAYYLKDEVGEALLMGTAAQYGRLVEKLRLQPAPLGLGVLAEEIAATLKRYDEPAGLWLVGDRSLPPQRRPYIIGLIPLEQPESAEGPGEPFRDAARRLVEAGADIIELEIGRSESVGRPPVEEQEWLTSAIAAATSTGALVAVATGEPAIATLALQAGARIINHRDQGNYVEVAIVVAQSRASLIVRPTRGGSLSERLDSLSRMLADAEINGVEPHYVAVDPCWPEDAFDASLLPHLKELRILGAPLVLTVPFGGPGRREGFPDDDTAETAGWVAMGCAAGANVVRAYNVRAAERSIRSLLP